MRHDFYPQQSHFIIGKYIKIITNNMPKTNRIFGKYYDYIEQRETNSI